MTYSKHRDQLPTAEPTDIEWAMLAAYIDGEGCICIRRRGMSGRMKRHSYYVELCVTNTDIRLLVWIKERFGGRVISHTNGKRKPHWKECWAWAISCNQATPILKGCLPYFVIKREQAELALAFQELVKRRPGLPRTTPEPVLRQQADIGRSLSRLKGTAARSLEWRPDAESETVN